MSWMQAWTQEQLDALQNQLVAVERQLEELRGHLVQEAKSRSRLIEHRGLLEKDFGHGLV